MSGSWVEDYRFEPWTGLLFCVLLLINRLSLSKEGSTAMGRHLIRKGGGEVGRGERCMPCHFVLYPILGN